MMSISFEDDMGEEAKVLIKKHFAVETMDDKCALLKRMELLKIDRKKLTEISNAAKQPVALEFNKIGDRKEVGGRVYELDEKGWRRLPIGTPLEKGDVSLSDYTGNSI